MKPAGVHQVAICVDDVDAALKFYVGVLGCEQRSDRPDFGFPGAWLDAGTQQIHLMQFGAPAPSFSHFALRVDDTEACCADLEAAGVEFRRSDYVAGAGRQVFLKDPAGNEIELNQPDR